MIVGHASTHRRLPCPQHLRHAPCLGDAAARREGWIAVEDFADAAYAVVSQVVDEGLQEGAGQLTVAVDAQVGADERAEQPAPNSALVVGAVTLAQVAAVMGVVLRVIRREAAQAVWGQQVTGANIHYGPGLLERQGAVVQGDGK